MSAGYSDPIDVTVEGYAGPKLFRVTHPRHGGLLIAAPDEVTAIVAAAKRWKRRWQDWDFYTDCIVNRSR